MRLVTRATMSSGANEGITWQSSGSAKWKELLITLYILLAVSRFLVCTYLLPPLVVSVRRLCVSSGRASTCMRQCVIGRYAVLTREAQELEMDAWIPYNAKVRYWSRSQPHYDATSFAVLFSPCPAPCCIPALTATLRQPTKLIVGGWIT
ncbi:hypothetical protein F4782DRAFT_189126 [Xylaria castorea]|nr:hypothetical protein F4782DRAFT_189126 [Xylaria castorea]